MKRPRRGSAPLAPDRIVTVFRGGGATPPSVRVGPNGLISIAPLCAPRLLTQPITLMRDLHCIRAGESYFPSYRRPTGRLPIPRHPVVRSDKPELRQQLTD